MSEGQTGLVLLRRRRVAEHRFGWAARFPRQARDYDHLELIKY